MTSGKWQFWIDRGGTFTDIVARDPGRQPVHPQAAEREPRPLPRRRDRRHQDGARRCRSDAADPARRDRGGEDGHHRRHQRAAGAQGRAHAAGGQPRLRRRAAHRQPGPAAAVRPRDHAADACCTSGSRRSAAASASTARRSSRSTKTPRAPRFAEAARRRHQRLRHRADARLEISRRTSGAWPNSRARPASPRSPPATRSARCCAWCRAATPRWWMPISRRSCAAMSIRSRPNSTGVRLYFMQSNGGLAEAGELPGQGRDPVRARPAASSARRAPRRWPGSTGSSASTWAAPRPTSRSMPARSSAPSRPRSPACACARR